MKIVYISEKAVVIKPSIPNCYICLFWEKSPVIYHTIRAALRAAAKEEK